MKSGDKNKALLQFVRRIIDVSLGYSKEELIAFHHVVWKQFPALLPLVEDYIALADRSDVEGIAVRRKRKEPASAEQMHLFDLLRDKRLFPSNRDLSRFASRVLPGMQTYRFDKMSKGNIASRIIEYLETLKPDTRAKLEASMREAIAAKPAKSSDRRSFLSKWERIIKGIEL